MYCYKQKSANRRLNVEGLMETTREVLLRRRMVLLAKLPERARREYLREDELPDQFNRDEVDSLIVRNIAKDLLRVEHAFKRLEAGTYGQCTRCAKPLAPNRLAAIPEAPACTECEEEVALKKKGIALPPPKAMRRTRAARN